MKEHFVKKARKDIHLIGKPYEATIHTKKYPEGKVVTRYDRSQSDVKDCLEVRKGQSYYWIKFRYYPKKVKLSPFTAEEKLRYPKSEWVERITALTSQVEEVSTQDCLDEVEQEIENLKSELEERLENIPEQLRESHILSTYIEQVDELSTSLYDKELEDE